MTQYKTDLYKRMFQLGALWNLGMGLFGLIGKDLAVELLISQSAVAIINNEITLLYYRFFMLAVIIFGTGYYLVSVDIAKNRVIVWLGLISKLAIFMIILPKYITGSVTILFFLAETVVALASAVALSAATLATAAALLLAAN